MKQDSKFDPKKHHRRSRNIRLEGYDYSSEGLYFITICVKNRKRLFGEIINRELKKNGAGMMIEKWYYKLESKFLGIKCHAMIVMPDHFHCIIELYGNGPSLQTVIHWFKTMTTNKYIRGVKQLGWCAFDGKLWQRGYYETILRDERAYRIVSEYITNNSYRRSRVAVRRNPHRQRIIK